MRPSPLEDVHVRSPVGPIEIPYRGIPMNLLRCTLFGCGWVREKFRDAARLAMALLLVVSGSAVFSAAQQYEILRADYGAGNQRRDVTVAFRQAVCSQPRFRMGNSTFGFDPAPGLKKSLRVYVRGPRGQQTTQEFPESSTIDGTQYNCRGGGGGMRPPVMPPNRGQYTIMNAAYGTDRRNVDVTNRLRDLASRNTTFRMGNSTFGVDPDPGRIKMLRIYARASSGQRRMFEYREGSTIDGSMFTGWRNGNWGRDPWNGRWNDSDYR
jgi:hypothetical protein